MDLTCFVASPDLIVHYSFPSFVYPTAAKRHLCSEMGKLTKRTGVWPALPIAGENEATKCRVACPTIRLRSKHSPLEEQRLAFLSLHPGRAIKTDTPEPGFCIPVLGWG